MGKLAETLVWERSRAGKSDLLMLVKIADGADDEGHNAWMEVPRLMKYCRASERAVQNTLCRLVDNGEIEIEYNDEGREIVLRGGRRFRPKWFIHVRCVCAWADYQNEASESADAAGLRRGRPRRKSATPADSGGAKNRRKDPDNPQPAAKQSAETGSAYKEGSLNDLLVEQEQGRADAPPVENAGAARQTEAAKDEDPNQHLSVITKLAHEVLDLHAEAKHVEHGEIAEAVKRRCALFGIAYGSDVVYRAIDSAVYQRQRAGKSPVLRGSAGDAAFRLQESRF